SMTVLMFCFLFGLIHLFVGLAMKAYMCIKAKRYLDVIYDVISWYLFVGGGILALLSTDILRSMTGFVLPAFFLPIGSIMAIIGVLIILFFAGRGSSPVKRALKGIYGIYGITSYLSDLLSYSRLLALGLATGVIAQVFNQIGTMLGGGVAGALLFTVVFIIGHSLNIGINALGAYVHTNRLQFVEFFGKFYEGGGSKFTPFKINTKNYKIKEEIFNG
ncbi:MAG: V-type ATPase 116kDa subunit family protein, partial [Acutalibacteraceae bacterium]|nr:V-type ATPase 116kDa subunit family protein [Acutalibacteraceae bacterium]